MGRTLLPPSAVSPGDVSDIALVGFAAIFASVAIAALVGYLHDRARLRLAVRLLDQGQPVPDALFDRRATTALVRGIVLLAGAIGIALFFLTGSHPALARAALVPGAIGVGYLVGHRLERRARGRDVPPDVSS